MDASRLVGVHERTGLEWRDGRTDPNRFGAPARFERAPAACPARPRYPGEGERIHIADRLWGKATVRAIAAELGRSPSTVGREIRRSRRRSLRGGLSRCRVGVRPGGRWRGSGRCG
ncbi:helix-turn-helix domain-containing protein [Kitasatospora sp. NPDC097605]|uniref:helix-turn-helix domain-containing protein n=1 Tax=Kitasatospora sp. NPDC097605 TaxID=3157226 RepID=UPI00331773C9